MWFTLTTTGDVYPCEETHYFGEEKEPMATQQVYTTGQAARILCVAPRTVCKWFDQGRLRGYRVPGSQERRIPRENLAAFITEHGLALPAELTHSDGCSCGSPDCPQQISQERA